MSQKADALDYTGGVGITYTDYSTYVVVTVCNPGSNTNIVIPETIDWKPVTEINK